VISSVVFPNGIKIAPNIKSSVGLPNVEKMLLKVPLIILILQEDSQTHINIMLNPV
jgi:hypothetical protein